MESSLIPFPQSQPLVQAGFERYAEQQLRQTIPLGRLLEGLEPLPPFTMVLGQAKDGAPLLIDLTSNAPGSMLFAGDVSLANKRALRALLASACYLNDADQVNIHFVTPHAGDFPQIIESPHCMQVYSPYQRAAEILVDECCQLLDQRMQQQSTGPVHLLAVDGLDLLIEQFHPEYLEDLAWLAQEGPRHMTFVLATFNTQRFSEAALPLIEAFSSRVLGPIHVPELATYLAEFNYTDTSNLVPGVEARVRSGGELITFRIPAC